jgi:hypothetical protein
MNLEGFLDESLAGGQRGYGATFRKAVKALKGISFAVAGSLAYSIRIEPTYTRDIDLLVDPAMWRQALNALARAGFRVEGDSILARATDSNGVWVDLMFGGSDPEESAREDAPITPVLRAHVPVVTNGHMLWMYLLSDQGRHKDRGIELIRRSGLPLVARVATWLRYDQDDEAEGKLKAWYKESQKPRSTWKDRRK